VCITYIPLLLPLTPGRFLGEWEANVSLGIIYLRGSSVVVVVVGGTAGLLCLWQRVIVPGSCNSSVELSMSPSSYNIRARLTSFIDAVTNVLCWNRADTTSSKYATVYLSLSLWPISSPSLYITQTRHIPAICAVFANCYSCGIE
jgi:hypothetical protein